MRFCCMFQLVCCQVSIRYMQRWQNAYHSVANMDKPSTQKPNPGLHSFPCQFIVWTVAGEDDSGPFLATPGGQAHLETLQWNPGIEKRRENIQGILEDHTGMLRKPDLPVTTNVSSYEELAASLQHLGKWRQFTYCSSRLHRPLEKLIGIYSCLAASSVQVFRSFQPCGI